MEQFVIKMMIDDVYNSILELRKKQMKYVDLDHSINADFEEAIKSLQLTLNNLGCDLMSIKESQ